MNSIVGQKVAIRCDRWNPGAFVATINGRRESLRWVTVEATIKSGKVRLTGGGGLVKPESVFTEAQATAGADAYAREEERLRDLSKREDGAKARLAAMFPLVFDYRPGAIGFALQLDELEDLTQLAERGAHVRDAMTRLGALADDVPVIELRVSLAQAHRIIEVLVASSESLVERI